MKRMLLLACLLYASLTTAQRAAFMNGGFIAAAYSQHDQSIKLINTYINQAFLQYEHKGEEPQLWFVGTQLVIASKDVIAIAGVQKGEQAVYRLLGKPLYGTMAAVQEKQDTIIVYHITGQKEYCRFLRKANAAVAASAMSSDEKRICIAWKTANETILSCYETVNGSMVWETAIGQYTELEFFMNANGSLIAKWDGRVTELLNGISGKPVQTMESDQRCIRITSKDEIICSNNNAPIVTLFSKNKNGLFKETESVRLNQSRTNSADGKEVVVQWDEKCVSDDLKLTIGFGTRAIALGKNGPIFLFF